MACILLYIKDKKNNEVLKMIFNIQKCSIHDGQGIRTNVFFKGCPLRCKWCANPESQLYTKEIMEFPRKCIACDACKEICPQEAISLTDGEMKIDRQRCVKCFRCTEVCYAESKELIGQEITPEEIFREVNKDRFFYMQKGGGVTFSGGEPLTQPDLLAEAAALCRKNRIHTVIETCGAGNYEEFKKALPYIDAMFFDLKHMDTNVHKELTGAGNEQILDNLIKITTHGIPITIRTPVIPGYNDSEENIITVAEFIKELPHVENYELLPYHNLGESKYKALGREYELSEVEPPTEEHIITLVKSANRILKPYGKHCFYTKENRKEIIE